MEIVSNLRRSLKGELNVETIYEILRVRKMEELFDGEVSMYTAKQGYV